MTHGILHCLLAIWSLCPFFFNDTATTEIYTLSLHDALPISSNPCCTRAWTRFPKATVIAPDRKSTRLNSSHGYISYAVFCLKKTQQHLQELLGRATPRHACRRPDPARRT